MIIIVLVYFVSGIVSRFNAMNDEFDAINAINDEFDDSAVISFFFGLDLNSCKNLAKPVCIVT